jgi:hypothetical protein
MNQKADDPQESVTPTTIIEDESTQISFEQCIGDPVALQQLMSHDQLVAFRNKAFEAGGEPWALDGEANELPHFQAGEIEIGDIADIEESGE